MHEVLLYTWKYQHTLKLKLVHDDIEDGTICVLKMIRTPKAYCKGRGFNETVSFWCVKPMHKWRKITYPFYQQCPYYQGACRYEQKRQKLRNSYCLIEKFSTSNIETSQKGNMISYLKTNGLNLQVRTLINT